MADEDLSVLPATQPARWLGTGAVLLVAVRVATVLSTAAVTVAVARLLGPSLSGDYALMVAFLAAVTALSALGTDYGVVWLISRRRWSAVSAFLTTQLAALLLGAAGAVTGAAIYLAAEQEAFRGIGLPLAAITLASVPLALGWLYAAQIALARDEYGRSASIRAAFAGFSLLLVPPLAAAFNLTGALVAVLAANGMAWTVGLALRPRGAHAGARLSFAPLLDAARFGLRPYLANALGFVIYRFDLFILSAASGSAEVGFYAAAVAATSLLTLAPSGLSSVLFPRLAALKSSPARRDQVEARAIRHTVLVLLPSALLLAVAIALLLEPVFGAPFAPAVEPALILIPGAAALGLATTLYASLLGRGRPEYTLRAGAIVAPLSLVLYAVLIPPLGASGAAIASSLSYAASAALAAFYVLALTSLGARELFVPTRADLHDYRKAARRLRALPRRGGRHARAGG